MDDHCQGQLWEKIPKSCPFTIEEYHVEDSLPRPRHTTFLIREHDIYGEYPNIFVKVCQSGDENVRLHSSIIDDAFPRDIESGHINTSSKVIVLSDTGCGTEVPSDNDWRNISSAGQTLRSHAQQLQKTRVPYPKTWNIFTFLEYTINPGSQIPYLIMTTHCHYDHIMGISKFPPTARINAAAASSPNGNSCFTHSLRSAPPTTVLTSALGKPFVTPYSNLQKHSLANTLGLCAPKYEVGIWAEDYSRVTYHHQTNTTASTTPITTPYTILHTPGHTPDSLSWYDAEHRVICVGDSFYLKDVDTAHKAPWGAEPPMPTMFNLESDLADWWRSLHKVLDFVVQKNREFADEAVKKMRKCTSEDAGLREDGTQQPSSSFSIWPFSARRRHATRQTGFEPRKDMESDDLRFHASDTPDATSDPWLLVDLKLNQEHTKRTPRVHLAAAHTTSRADALDAILEIRAFVAAILRDDGTIPKQRVEDGTRGEEMWLWDYALVDDEASPDTAFVKGRRFSVLSPLVIIQEGRRKVPRAEWFDV